MGELKMRSSSVKMRMRTTMIYEDERWGWGWEMRTRMRMRMKMRDEDEDEDEDENDIWDEDEDERWGWGWDEDEMRWPRDELAVLWLVSPVAPPPWVGYIRAAVTADGWRGSDKILRRVLVRPHLKEVGGPFFVPRGLVWIYGLSICFYTADCV